MFIPPYKEVGPSAKCFGNYDTSSNWCYLCNFSLDCWKATYKDKLKLQKHLYKCRICKEEFSSIFSYSTALYFHRKLKKGKIENLK
ncbi:MAG: hypothetical protein ACTSVY_08335 [Candidatus Helarchaeota archaeon]